MGQTIGKKKTSPDIDNFMRQYPHFEKYKIINKGLLYKTISVTNEFDKAPLIVKIFFKNDYDLTIYDKMRTKMEEIQKKINDKKIKPNSYTEFYNVCPIIKLEDNIRAGLLIRQNFFIDLKERMYTLPYLSKIEKIWIMFQFFYGIYQLHYAKIYHGDLKIENILLSSNNSVFISDISPFKPAYIQMDDLGNYYYYFGVNSTDNFKSCYLAPERFVDKNEFQEDKEFELKPSMDVFSAGVIFAEFILEENLLDLSKILSYKKDPNVMEQILGKIKNEKIRDLICKMTKLNPEERIDIKEVLEIMIMDICPIAMSQVLIHLNNIIVSTCWKPDIIIGLLYKHWKQIWKVLYGFNEKAPLLYQKLNFEIINQLTMNIYFKDFKDVIRKNKENEILKIQVEEQEKLYKEEFNKKHSINLDIHKAQNILQMSKNLENHFKKINNSVDDINKDNIYNNLYSINDFEIPNEDKKEENDELLFDLILDFDNLNNLKNEEEIDPSIFDKNLNKETARIFMDYLLQNLDSVKYDSSNLVALEMIKNFSMKFPDFFKIDIIIPYFVENLKRMNNLNNLTTINYLFELFYSIDYSKLTLPVFYFPYLSSYIFDSLLYLYHSKDNMLIIIFINSIEKIIDLEKKFLGVILRSNFKMYGYLNESSNLKNQENEIQTDNNNLEAQIEYYTKIEKKSKTEIFLNYDNTLKEFKDRLFGYISDIISNNEEIDVIIALIRQLPGLLNFYGQRKTFDFIKFIINNINNTEWIIQREIIKMIPKMSIILGEDNLNTYILPCMQELISNNSNELKQYELINCVYELLKIDYLPTENGIAIAQKLLPFIVHPNILIKNKMNEFLCELFSKLDSIDILANFFDSMKNFLYSPSFDLNKNILQEYTIKPLTRVIFQLELENFDFKEIDSFDVNPQKILTELIRTQKENSLGNDDVNYSFKRDTTAQSNLKGNNFYDIIPKEYKKFCKQNSSEENANMLTFICKLMWLGDLTVPLTIPNIKTNEDVIFKVNDNILTSSQNFRIRFLFRTLGINLKLVTLNDFFPTEEEENNNVQSEWEDVKTVKDNFKKKQFSKWRPKGQLIKTIYDHRKKSVEKLIPINNNQFASIDNEACFYIWDINYENNELNLKKNFTFNVKNERNYNILYNKTITLIDNSNFIFASGENLYQLNPQMKPTSNFLIPLYEKKNSSSSNFNNNITCCIGIGENMQQSQKIVFAQQNGYLNILDQRMNNTALRTYIPIERGIISCLYTKNNYNDLTLGTLGGYILNYDIRINSISNNYKYCHNKPIIGISSYISKHGFGHLNKYHSLQDYLMIWTGAEDHEISLWNKENLNCDYLFKVNKTYSNEMKPLTIEIPSLFKENENESLTQKTQYDKVLYDKILKINFDKLKNFNNRIYNKYKGILLSNIKHEFYNNIPERLKNLSNLYETQTTVQTAFSPINLVNENYPYIISAGNDMTIRYWSIAEEGNNNIEEKKQENYSYLINAPENISNCIFSKSTFCDSIILQSNEFFNLNGPKKTVFGFSEYQNYNGICYHNFIQNEFLEDEKSQNKFLNYCTRIAGAAHKNVITDIIPISLEHESDENNGDKFTNFLISSSWDGTVKIWK